MTGSALVAASLVPLAVSLLAAGAVAGLVVAVAVVLSQRETRLERRLAGYEVPEFAATPVAAGDVSGPETRVVQHAVELTSDLASRTGVLPRVAVLLEQAEIKLRPAEFLFYVPVAAIASFLLFALLWGPLPALLVTIGVAAAPFAWATVRRDRRLRQFQSALPDTLGLIAGSLRAGFSFLQGLEAVADESHGPMRTELHRVCAEARLGRPPEDALGDSAERMASKDLAWAVMALRIQREVGGNLAQLLDIIADTMHQRDRLHREIRSLTAEGRLSGVVLSIVPVAFAFILFAMKPEYIRLLFENTFGVVAVIGATILTVVGWFWIRKVVEIEV